MSFRAPYLLWKLTYDLMEKGQYRFLFASNNSKEVWLEKTEGDGVQLIHLNQYDLDWSNWLKQHNAQSIRQAEELRKKLRKRNLKVANIYITAFPPVDDAFDLQQNWYSPKDLRKLTCRTILLDQASEEDGIDLLSRLTKVEGLAEDRLQDPDEADILHVHQLSQQVILKKNKSETGIFQYGKPFFTYAFIIIQVAVFLWMESVGSSQDQQTLLEFGAKFNPLIIAGEWWRFITPIFIHIGLLHLFMNTLALYYLGAAVERIYGSGRFFFIYILSGIIGSIASFVFTPNLSAGASGAIFGCFGALLYFGFIQPRLFFRTMGMNVLVIIAINLAFGFTIPGIDNAGHVGGLIGGFIVTGIFHFPKKKNWTLQLVFLLVTAGLTWIALSYGYERGLQTEDGRQLAAVAQTYVNEEQYDKSYKLLSSYIENDGAPTAEVFFLLSYIEIQQDENELAIAHLEEAIQLNPSFHEAYYNLSLLYARVKQYDKAVQSAEKAYELQSTNDDYREWMEELQAIAGGE